MHCAWRIYIFWIWKMYLSLKFLKSIIFGIYHEINFLIFKLVFPFSSHFFRNLLSTPSYSFLSLSIMFKILQFLLPLNFKSLWSLLTCCLRMCFVCVLKKFYIHINIHCNSQFSFSSKFLSLPIFYFLFLQSSAYSVIFCLSVCWYTIWQYILVWKA